MKLAQFFLSVAVVLLWGGTAAAQTTPSNADICRADVDKSGVVDTPDVNAVNAAYRSRLGQPKFDPRVDFDNDKSITLADRTFITTKVGMRCQVAVPNRPPVFTSQPPLAVAYGGSYAYAVTTSDPDGDVVSVVLKQGPAGLTLTAGTVRWVPLVVGAQTVVLEASDGRGGVATQQFQIAVAPPPPPQVSIAAPQTGLVTRTAAVVVSGTVSDVSLAQGTLRVNGVDRPLTLTNGTFSAAVTLVEGPNRFVASASNAGGPGTSAEVVVTLDSVGPTLESRMPLSVGAGEHVPLLAEAFDLSGVASVALQVNGTPVATMSRLPYVFTVDVPQAATQGQAIPLSFTAVDTLGNTRTIQRQLVVNSPTDTTAPAVLLSMPSSARPGELVPVVLSAEDDRAVASMALARGGDTLREVVETPFAVQHPFRVPEDAVVGQTIELTGRATDAAGNEGTTSASLLVVLPSSETSGLHLALNPVASPTFQPTQVISGVVSTVEVQSQNRPRPFVASLSVTQGRQGERLEVGVEGANSNFEDGVSQAVFGAGITVNAVTVQSPTSLTVDITIADDATVGPRLVSVQTGNEEALLLNAFNVRSGVGTVSGRLRDTDGAALANAEVCVPGPTVCTTTGADGTFTLAGAPANATRVSVTIPGQNQVSVPLQLAVNGAASLGDIVVELQDAPPPPPPAGGPQPPPAVAKVLGLGLGDASVGPSLSRGRRLVTDAFIAAGGTEAGVLDENGRQLNPEVAGTGLITLTQDGVRVLAHRMERGESVGLGDLLFALSFGFVWNGPTPTLSDWLEVMQERVNAAWASPLDPESVLPILVFNRDRVMTATPPVLAPDLRLGPVQAALLISSFLGSMLPEANVPLAGLPPTRPLLVADAFGAGGGRDAMRRWWESAGGHPVSDSPLGLPRLLAAAQAQQGGNARRLTGFWRNAFAAKSTFVTQTLNNAYMAELKLMFALSLPAMAPAGLLTVAANVAIAGAYIGPISNLVQGAYGAVNAAVNVPEPPDICDAGGTPVCETRVAVGADGKVQVHVEFKLSRSHLQPRRDEGGITWAYSLYRFRTTDSERQFVGSVVVPPDGMVPVRGIGGTVDRLVSAITAAEFRNAVVLTITDSAPLPLVMDDLGNMVPANTATWFYAVTATEFRGLADEVRPELLANAVPWWNYALGGRIDPGGLMALHTKARHMFVSDYSAPKVLTVDSTGQPLSNDGLEIDPITRLAYYSDTTKRQIFRVDIERTGERTLFAVPGFKDAQNGFAMDSAGSLYTNNEASNAEFGGRMFRFQQPGGARDHVGNINYYSFLLQSAHPASASAMAMGPGSQPGVSVEDLFLVDDLAQQVKRVPVRATFDPTRRIGQPWATLPFPARSVDFEFYAPVEGSPDRPDGVLLMDGLPAATLTVEADVKSLVALGDQLTLALRIGNPSAQTVSAVLPVLTMSGEGTLQQVTPPPAVVQLAPGAVQDYTVVFNATGSGAVTLRMLGQGNDAGGVTISSPPVERVVTVGSPLAITIAAPRQAAPSAVFDVTVEARNLSTTNQLVDVLPTITTFDATLDANEPDGAAIIVSGPQPATLLLAPGAKGTFTFQFRGTHAGRVGLEAKATAKTPSNATISAVPDKTNVNLVPLTVDLEVPTSIKKDAVAGAVLVLRNLSDAAVTAEPYLEFFGLGRVEVTGANPFAIVPPALVPSPVAVPANGETRLAFDLKGVRAGLAQLEAFARVTIDGASITTDRDTERVGIGPTLTGLVSDIGLKSLNLAYNDNFLYNSVSRVGVLAGLVVAADDGRGVRVESTTNADGRYTMALEHSGPWVVTVVQPGRNVGVTIRDVRVPLGEDSFTQDVDLPVTLVSQARLLAETLQQLPIKVDDKGATVVDPGQANLGVGYAKASAAFLNYLQRFQQGASTPFFEYPLRAGGKKEPGQWDSLMRTMSLMAFTKRRFDEAAVITAPFVKIVVDHVVSALRIGQIGENFDKSIQKGINDTFFKVPENSSLAKELTALKIDFDKLGKNLDELEKNLNKVNTAVCKHLQTLVTQAVNLGVATPDDRASLIKKCDEYKATSATVYKRVFIVLKVQVGQTLAPQIDAALRQAGMLAGVQAMMEQFASLLTEDALLYELHRAERTLEMRGDTVDVLFAIRELDSATHAEVVRLYAKIGENADIDNSVKDFLTKASKKVDKEMLAQLKQGLGVIGKVTAVLTALDYVELGVQAALIGPGTVCRAANEVFRAEGANVVAQEPPATSLFCVQDLPLDK